MGRTLPGTTDGKPYVGVLVIGDPSGPSWTFIDSLCKLNAGIRVRVEGNDQRWLISIFNDIGIGAQGTLLAMGQGPTRDVAVQELNTALVEAARVWKKSVDPQLGAVKMPARNRRKR